MRTLYASDLDRTLLRSDSSLGPESVRLLNHVIREGVLFTYATARSHLSSRRATQQLELQLPVITYGGTITADADTGRARDLHRLGDDAVTGVLNECRSRPDAQPILHTYEDGRDWVRWRPEHMTAGTRAFLGSRPQDPRLRPITTEDPLDRRSVFYISILAERDVLGPMRESLGPALAGVATFLSVDPSTPGLDWLELHSEDGTKARALQRLMTQTGADRLVVFGDNENDLPMFAIADESYAVANAIPSVRAAATGVIDDNDSDAVARWIAHDAKISMR
ncbi:HAD hydrolase family protein [Microbacterium sp. NPDC077663]|uniref:HAD hydrolase family protein n=1 Tax=Microbacterium sp. NPDC077663 TaxID=3364189 RepID=UPI0037C853F2